ncbi:MAG: hypothetical protein LBB45_02480 [Methanobrevibacter sp.]|nr:hypothetical protein [Candidatus Methanovirga basalitermitum]
MRLCIPSAKLDDIVTICLLLEKDIALIVLSLNFLVRYDGDLKTVNIIWIPI